MAADNPGDELPTPADNGASASEPGRRDLHVAGLVASAGGLDAFKKFFAAMPADSGIAFVLVPHLDPKHESLMVELLRRHTAMPVVEAEEGMAVEANRVCIIPPNKNMTISGGVLRLTGPVERSNWQTSIDLFLRSLADDQLEKAICIILSGTGSHGTLGLKAVKAAGGLALVQDPGTADSPGMPASAVATGLADHVLPVEQMPEALVKYVQHFHVNGGKVVAAVAEAPDHLNQLLALLRARTKFDFRCYRKKMMARRLERRMGLGHFENVVEYLAHLREHPEEVAQLVRDLLVSVTRFFRDPEAFDALEKEVLVALLQAKDADTPLRVWVPGCATGEEAYSVAMLLLEHQTAAQNPCHLQIFATDVDEQALEVARRGIYPEGVSADVNPERLARFFTRADESTFQITKQVRETVTFAVQNLIADAPFSRMDLISCRNLLIYLEPEVQQKVIALLHFALKEGGCLLLGPSETVGRQPDLFEPVSQKWRIYRRIGPVRAEALQFPVMQAEPRQARPQSPIRPPAPPRLAELVQNSLLRRLALACVVINRNYEILHFGGPTEDYLVQPGGPPTLDLLSMARQGLESKLRVVIHGAIRENSPQSIQAVMMRPAGETRLVHIAAEPLNQSKQTQGLLLISFQELPNPSSDTPAEPGTPAETAEPDLLHQFAQELESTRSDLQSTIEELESANEELKASNEEVISMNEELQSANEELETSKEELQSLNEELTTVNNQLQDKVEEAESANNNLANLLHSTDIATVFLDAALRIKLFTPAATRMFNLIAADLGRAIGDIVRTFTDDDLLRAAQQVLRDLTPCEKEVSAADGRWYIRRIVPYRTLDNRIDGVTITFVDITERKQAGDAVVRRLAAVVENSADVIFSKDLDGTIRTWNRGAERLYGYSRDEAVARSVKMLVPEDRTDEWTRGMAMLARGEHVEQLETERIRKDGQRVTVALTVSPIRDSDGKVVSGSVTGRDITERKRAEEELRRLTAELRAKVEELTTLLDILPAGVLMADPECRRITGNRAFYEMLGLPQGANASLTAEQPDLPAGTRVYRDGRELPADEFPMQATGRSGRRIMAFDHDLVFPDGRVVTFLANTAALLDEHGGVRGVVGAYMDISERKRAEEALRDREARLAAILSTAADGIITIDVHGAIQSVNAAAERMFGYAAAEMIGQNVKMLMPAPYRDEHDRYLARYVQTGVKHMIGIGREVEGRRKDGATFPVDLAVSEVGRLKLFTGLLRDISRRKELEREVVQIASLEQRRIGQDLHDSVSQELTALNMLAGSLADALPSNPANGSHLVERLLRGLQRSQQALRAVMRGLLPVSVDAEGLMAALSDLAKRTREEGKVTCVFDCPEPVLVADNLIATHLYLIAQEAVHNAVKHARCQNIRISVESKDRLVLRVQDDGVGIPDQPAENYGGSGLRIMRNRAAIIRATLTIEQALPSGAAGTCVLGKEEQ